MHSELLCQVEALIFCATEPITPEELKRCLCETYDATISDEDITVALEALRQRYDQPMYAFGLCALAGGYQFMTKPDFQPVVQTLLRQNSKKRLSPSALETLAIIAYKQPVTKTEVEQIRGVTCDYALQKLLEKELVEILGKAETPGRPLLYGTSRRFMEHFGLNSLKDLPTLKEVVQPKAEIGNPN
ncbi:segregation and condensation protein B [Catalinimonas alkaloidigena]|uniref:Segregation and condensation protein B n=1 Tax=Catalinimonas alkaloidigena TaxID=1075417 RepID=A0A1G9Q677_9BACT|nr:SMC-Scp complex subunit ScpB [Catalinimonas alkaloidigena]SDM05987.1 segregation and condensation protein B [Catalinimonas alkaloidigena]